MKDRIIRLIDDELRWAKKCEAANMRLPADAVIASLTSIKAYVERLLEDSV